MSRNAMNQCIEDVNCEAEQRETHRQEWLAEVAARQAERSPYCECMSELMLSEIDSGKCAHCGRAVLS